ncbi:MAG: hypothetical protein L6263_01310 [Desulfobacteraceae bacterium]|nr:hypothetical protein [Desulfobacteraceae bacterium]
MRRKKDKHRTPACHASQTMVGGMIIVTGPRHYDILLRPSKGIAGRSNAQHRMMNDDIVSFFSLKTTTTFEP